MLQAPRWGVPSSTTVCSGWMAESSPRCAEDTGPWAGAGGGAKTAASSSAPIARMAGRPTFCQRDLHSRGCLGSSPDTTEVGGEDCLPCLSVCWLVNGMFICPQNSKTSLASAQGTGPGSGPPSQASGSPSAWPSWQVPSQTRAFGHCKDAHDSGDGVWLSQACAKQDRASANHPGTAPASGWKRNVPLRCSFTLSL